MHLRPPSSATLDTGTAGVVVVCTPNLWILQMNAGAL